MINKQRAVIWGAGGTGKRIKEMIDEKYEVISFLDSDAAKAGMTVAGIPVVSPDNLFTMQYDKLFYGSLMGLDEMTEYLSNTNVPSEKIDKTYVQISVESRILFLKNFSKECYFYKIPGSVGEAGVYRGAYSYYINKYFPDRKCYLFDTFEGFSSDDFKFEKEDSLIQAEHLKETSEERVLNIMPNNENIILKKGYFPETAEGIEDKFCFINLDMDLYKPTLGGLQFFYPKMVENGVILIHDYFSEAYPNVRRAVDDYEKISGEKLCRVPIGDDISLAVIKRGTVR